MSIPNQRTNPGKWIEWILQNPGHPAFAVVDFASRYREWHQGGQVGPVPEFFKSLPIEWRRLVWNPVIEEIVAAREVFDKLIAEGIMAYRVKQDGSPGSRVVHFNPVAEELVFRIA